MHFNPDGQAILKLLVKAGDHGVIYNRISASAAIPEIYYLGSGTPTFLMNFEIPSASSYDWSAYPPYTVTRPSAIWDEQLKGQQHFVSAAAGERDHTLAGGGPAV